MARFVTQAEFARHRKVSRKTATVWKQKGLLVLTDEGRVDLGATDERLRAHGIGNNPVTGNTVSAPEGNKPLGNNSGPDEPARHPGLYIVDLIDEPFDAGAMTMGMFLFYRIGRITAAMAVYSGAPCKVAFSLAKSVQLGLLMEVVDYAKQAGVRPFRDGQEPDFVHMDSIEPTNWKELAKLAGEQVDMPAWLAYHAEKHGEQEEAASQ